MPLFCEIIKYPDDNLYDNTEYYHSGQREIKFKILFFNSYIARKTAHPGKSIAPKIPNKACECDDEPKKNNPFCRLLHNSKIKRDLTIL